LNIQQVLEHVNQKYQPGPVYQYVEDQVDYWQSPDEFEESKAGDCEDFAIAKFFALKGVVKDKGKLSLAHVSLANGQQHMVCMYGDMVLDIRTSLVVDIKHRPDIAQLIYKFNEDSLTIGTTVMKGVPNIKPWKEVLARMS